MDIEELIRSWDGEAVITHFDQPTRSWFFIAIHDSTLGVPMGGTRMKVYPNPAAALYDAMRLAEGMTHKWAAVEFDVGGGKAVIAPPELPRGTPREGLLHRYGQLLASLKGCFMTGQDLGTSPEDMMVVARACGYVHGCDPQQNLMRDPGPYTARGVFVGIQAAVKHALGRANLSGCQIWIEGAGDVGSPLARKLSEAGAVLSVSDVAPERARSLAEEVGGRAVEAEAAYSLPCDVYAPCAAGGTINPQAIAQLQCQIVAGCANNQLEAQGDADRLHQRGILYAPDYIINAGGAIAFSMMHGSGAGDDVIHSRIDRIATTLDQIFSDGSQRSESPVHSARKRVEMTLSRARQKAGR